jgi:hypothetical protein
VFFKLSFNNILAESTLTSHGMIYAGETINHWIVGGSDGE